MVVGERIGSSKKLRGEVSNMVQLARLRHLSLVAGPTLRP